MKRHFLSLLVSGNFFLFVNPWAHALGGWISGGGDPLRIYFEEGQLLAQNLLPIIDPNMLGPEFNAEQKKWLNENKSQLARDLAQTKLNWTVDERATCAQTEYKPSAEIILAVPNCRGIVTKEEAAKVLIHEATHHLGIQDETFADKIAVLSFAAFEINKIKSVPECPQKDPELTNHLAGVWQFDRALTNKIGGLNEPGPRGEIEFTVNRSIAKEFPAFGRCAFTAGHMRITNPRGGHYLGNYVVAKTMGRPVLVIHRLESVGGSPLGNNLRQFSIDLTIGPENDLLFLGDKKTGESKAAFRKGKVIID
jgi:hypothetical protein